MASITQNSDGSYSKSYSDLELSLVKGLVDEAKLRQQGDQELWVDITGVSNRVSTLEESKADYDFLQSEVLRMMKEVEKSNAELSKIDLLLGMDTYTKEQVDQLLVLWFVEQIPHVFTQPRSAMFNNVNIDDIKSGYKGYLMADIKEPHDNHIPENTMQRYTINAFIEVPKEVTFQVSFADRCTFVLNGVEQGVWADSEGNFSSVPKVLVLDFKEGWNKVEIMIANETQRGGLVVTSDLYEKADYLHNLSNFAGMITGSRIAPGTLDETHLSPNMDLVVNTVHATAENVPAVIVGNPDACGILQIGDKTISKCVNEPFVIDDGIRVNGYIYVSQLLIDKDFVLEGDGIFIEKQIDVTTGFTEAYIIHNDMVINNGGGLTLVGDARKGYTITNAMKLTVDGDLNGWLPPNPAITSGGLDISGDAVKGYYIRNNMLLRVEGTGGLIVTGNAHDGYHIKNTMNLSSPKGLEVIGDPSEAAGYKLRNKMTLTGSGVVLTASLDDESYYNWNIENDTKITVGNGIDVSKLAAGEFKIWNTLEVIAGDGMRVVATGSKTAGFSKYEIINDMKLTTDCGGIEVRKEGDGHWSISNAMSLSATPNSPVTRVAGNACQGYIIESAWPNISGNTGIEVTHNGSGTYSVKNTGVIQVSGSGAARVTGSQQYPTVHVDNVSLSSPDGSINITGSNNSFQLTLNQGAIDFPEVEIPPQIMQGYASITSQGHGSNGDGGFRYLAQNTTSSAVGIGKGDVIFRDSTYIRVKIDVALETAAAVSNPKIYARAFPAGSTSTAGSAYLKQFEASFSASAVGIGSYTTVMLDLHRDQIAGTPDEVVIGIFVDASVVNASGFLFKITGSIPM